MVRRNGWKPTSEGEVTTLKQDDRTFEDTGRDRWEPEPLPQEEKEKTKPKRPPKTLDDDQVGGTDSAPQRRGWSRAVTLRRYIRLLPLSPRR